MHPADHSRRPRGLVAVLLVTMSAGLGLTAPSAADDAYPFRGAVRAAAFDDYAGV